MVGREDRDSSQGDGPHADAAGVGVSRATVQGRGEGAVGGRDAGQG